MDDAENESSRTVQTGTSNSVPTSFQPDPSERDQAGVGMVSNSSSNSSSSSSSMKASNDDDEGSSGGGGTSSLSSDRMVSTFKNFFKRRPASLGGGQTGVLKRCTG